MFLPQDLTLVVAGEVSAEMAKLEKAGFLTLLRDPKHFLYEKRADGEIDEFLANSIGKLGVLQGIRIMRDGDQKVVMVGRQRVKSAALHNYRLYKEHGAAAEKSYVRIPSMLYRADEAKALMAIVAENEMRIQDTPVHRAEKMQRLLDLGFEEAEVGAAFRMGLSQLKASLRLLDCAPEVRQAVESGELPAYVAHSELVTLPRSEQAAALTQMREAGTLRGEAAKSAVAELKMGKKPTPRDPATIGKNRPTRKRVEAWIKKLQPKAEKSKLVAGVILGLKKSIGQNTRGWGEIQAIIDDE
jgi:ParB family chromosome partitioning protein